MQNMAVLDHQLHCPIQLDITSHQGMAAATEKGFASFSQIITLCDTAMHVVHLSLGTNLSKLAPFPGM
ncbi:MAG: hypothetical protein U9R15_16550, partial [Chloroflexota bacterium]|nr:hypothetical protein [Chloroflexota bacterium]